jgi:hypothetical protein
MRSSGHCAPTPSPRPVLGRVSATASGRVGPQAAGQLTTQFPTFARCGNSGAMKIADLQSVMRDAFLHAGLRERRLFPKGAKAWSLTEGELIRFFQPQPYRRGWGFVYTGYVGIEIPRLRSWLASHHPGDPGIFHHSFVAHHTLNDPDRAAFMTDLAQPVPADQWAAIIRARLERLPSSLGDLVSACRDDPDRLAALQRPTFPEAWPFLLRWAASPDAVHAVPKIGAIGQVAE